MPLDPRVLARLKQSALSSESAADVMNVEVPDALADRVETTGDLEKDSEAELTQLQQDFRDRAAREDERFRLATDSEFWFAVCFRSREDKKKFLAASGLIEQGDKYLDGYVVAEILNVDIE
jgi:hypothetical protein